MEASKTLTFNEDVSPNSFLPPFKPATILDYNQLKTEVLEIFPAPAVGNAHNHLGLPIDAYDLMRLMAGRIINHDDEDDNDSAPSDDDDGCGCGMCRTNEANLKRREVEEKWVLEMRLAEERRVKSREDEMRRAREAHVEAEKRRVEAARVIEERRAKLKEEEMARSKARRREELQREKELLDGELEKLKVNYIQLCTCIL